MDYTSKELLERSRAFWVFGVWAVLVVALVLGGASALWGAEKEDSSVTTTYVLNTDGDKIGDITLERRSETDGGKTLLITEQFLDIKVSGFWGKWEMSSKGYIASDEQGIVIYDTKITEDGKNWRILGERHGKSLWCSARQVLSKAEMDEEDLTEIAKMVASSAIPHAGTAFTLLDTVSPKESGGDIRFSLDSFDTTDDELGVFLWHKEKDLKEQEVKVLDTVELEIRKYVVNRQGDETLAIASKSLACRTYKIKRPEGECVQWVAKDAMGPFLVKESGKDKDGDYEIFLTGFK